MSHVVILGAGLGGVMLAYEMKAKLRREEVGVPKAVATWDAVCLADFGDDGIAFVAQPQILPRNVNWASQGKWVHAAKIGFEKYFLRKVRQGKADTFYENLVLDMLGIRKLKEIHIDTAE